MTRSWMNASFRRVAEDYIKRAEASAERTLDLLHPVWAAAIAARDDAAEQRLSQMVGEAQQVLNSIRSLHDDERSTAQVAS